MSRQEKRRIKRKVEEDTQMFNKLGTFNSFSDKFKIQLFYVSYEADVSLKFKIVIKTRIFKMVVHS